MLWRALATPARNRVPSPHHRPCFAGLFLSQLYLQKRNPTMAKIKGMKCKVETHEQYKVPHRIYDIETTPSKKSPQKIAESVLKKIASQLKIKPDLSQLKFDKVKESILGSHVLYQQYHAGKQISGAWIRADVDKEGRVFYIQNDLVPEPVMEETRKAEAR